MSETQQKLYSLEQASRALGNVSHWLLRKHICAGRIKVTRIGTRVFIPDGEIARLAKEGLPSLSPQQSSREAASKLRSTRSIFRQEGNLCTTQSNF